MSQSSPSNDSSLTEITHALRALRLDMIQRIARMVHAGLADFRNPHVIPSEKTQPQDGIRSSPSVWWELGLTMDCLVVFRRLFGYSQLAALPTWMALMRVWRTVKLQPAAQRYRNRFNSLRCGGREVEASRLAENLYDTVALVEYLDRRAEESVGGELALDENGDLIMQLDHRTGRMPRRRRWPKIRSRPTTSVELRPDAAVAEGRSEVVRAYQMDAVEAVSTAHIVSDGSELVGYCVEECE